MSTVIGQHYTDAERTRITQVEYNGTSYEVYECLWDGEWQVTLRLPNGGKAATGAEGLYDHYQKQCDRIRVLAGLGYKLTKLDEDAGFWTKDES